MASSTGVSEEPEAAASRSTSDELRLVLVGKTGAGKSSTASTISGKKDVFKSSSRGKSMTTTCQCERVEAHGQKLLLTDTPGMFDTFRPPSEIDDAISEFVKMTAPGPHAILFVTSAANRFTAEEVGVVKKLQEMFGEAIETYLIIIVTRTEDWEDEDMDVISFLEDLPREAKQVLGTCIASRRVLAFKNKFSKHGDPKDTEQSKELLALIKETVKKNGNKCYTEEHWKKAEEQMKKREQEILEKEMTEEREKVEKLEREAKEKIEKEFDAKMEEMRAKQEQERAERERKEKEAREKREQELVLKMEQMRLEGEQKMETMKAEERARAQEELKRAEERMEEQRQREKEMSAMFARQAEEAAQRQEKMFQMMIEQQRQDAERRHKDQMEMEKRRLEEEARYRARKEEEKKEKMKQKEAENSSCSIQ